MSYSDVSPSENDRPEAVNTLTPYLSQYALGEKIRRLRLRKSMGLVELGRHTGLSAAMLSKLENNHVVPTLQTLSRIALVFSVGLDHFFNDPTRHQSIAITRSAERMDFDEKLDTKQVLYSFQCLDYPATERKSSSYLATFQMSDQESPPQHTHEGYEFIYVLTGTLGLKVEGEEVELAMSDTAYFNARLPHSYRRIGASECQAIVVTVP
ncbi:MAG: helix-turn-helix transcriptional regulator [bacterium]|nr:helix-turn-helix transcriptional regulator [bacterium]MBK8127880.1 helix-turn-helix transcriptional regulator [bacterium]